MEAKLKGEREEHVYSYEDPTPANQTIQIMPHGLSGVPRVVGIPSPSLTASLTIPSFVRLSRGWRTGEGERSAIGAANSKQQVSCITIKAHGSWDSLVLLFGVWCCGGGGSLLIPGPWLDMGNVKRRTRSTVG